jgi:pimeloyl-ACP methyl ester carboxylesterase
MEFEMPPTDDWRERRVSLPGRGEIFVRDSVGSSSAPTLLLLHGLGATGLLNWRPVFDSLSRAYRVVVVDHRGHGRGMRIRQPFRLADCADDVATLTASLGIERFFAVGYSMGGPISQLLWQRHRDRIEGMVLCATACRFASNDRRYFSHMVSPFLNVAGRVAPRRVIRLAAKAWLSDAILDPTIRDLVMSEVGSSDPVTVGQAAAAVMRFDSSTWISRVDVPTSIVVTDRDRLVPAEHQRAMADQISGSIVHAIPGDHSVCVTQPALFIPALEEACASVVRRARKSH